MDFVLLVWISSQKSTPATHTSRKTPDNTYTHPGCRWQVVSVCRLQREAEGGRIWHTYPSYPGGRCRLFISRFRGIVICTIRYIYFFCSDGGRGGWGPEAKTRLLMTAIKQPRAKKLDNEHIKASRSSTLQRFSSERCEEDLSYESACCDARIQRWCNRCKIDVMQTLRYNMPIYMVRTNL